MDSEEGVTVFEEEVEIAEDLGVEVVVEVAAVVVSIGAVVEVVLIGVAVEVVSIGAVAEDLGAEVATGVEGVVLKAENRGAEMTRVAETETDLENRGVVMAKGVEEDEVAAEILGATQISTNHPLVLTHHRKTKKSPSTINL